MSKNKEKFAYDSYQDCETITRHLRALADGLESGQLRLASDDRELVLEPQGMLRLHLRAHCSDARSRLALKITWRNNNHADSVDAHLSIQPSRPGEPG